MVYIPISIGAALLSAAPVMAEYCAIRAIHPSSNRYASPLVRKKIAGIEKSHGVIRHNGHTIPAYNNNTSVLPQQTPLTVACNSEGLILVDGNTDIIASIALGATTIPIRIVSDLDVAPASCTFDTLVDDPNYYFALITARHCTDQRTENRNTHGAPYPLWVKVGDETPGIEEKIADTLHKQGFVYDLAHKENPSFDELETARAILMADPIPGLRLVRTRKHYSEIPLICALTLPTHSPEAP